MPGALSTYHQKLLLLVMLAALLLGSALLMSGLASGFGLLCVSAGLAGAVFFVILCWRIISRDLDDAQCRIIERLHTVANTSPAMFWSAGLDKGCDWFNQRWFDFTGRTMEQESGDGWAQGVHPDDLERCLTLYTNAFDARESFTIEYRLRRHDGEYRWLLDQGMPRYDADGVFVGYIGSCLDITEEKKLRETLAASEANYRQLFEANPHPMWVYDLETLAFLAVNHAAEKHYGYSREEFLNMTIKDIRPPEDVPRLMQTVTNFKNGLSHSGYWRHLIKNGRVIDVEITSHLLCFEGRQAKLVLAHDVTERNRAEESLHESEQRYRELIESANSAILHWSPDGNISFINAFAQKFFGWSAAEIVGKPGASWCRNGNPQERISPVWSMTSRHIRSTTSTTSMKTSAATATAYG